MGVAMDMVVAVMRIWAPRGFKLTPRRPSLEDHDPAATPVLASAGFVLS